MTADAAALVARIRRWTKLPVAVGFGISNAEHVAQVAEFADAAVIGSAIVELDRAVDSGSSARRRGPIYQGPALAASGAGPVKEQPSAISHQRCGRLIHRLLFRMQHEHGRLEDERCEQRRNTRME